MAVLSRIVDKLLFTGAPPSHTYFAEDGNFLEYLLMKYLFFLYREIETDLRIVLLSRKIAFEGGILTGFPLIKVPDIS